MPSLVLGMAAEVLTENTPLLLLEESVDTNLRKPIVGCVLNLDKSFSGSDATRVRILLDEIEGVIATRFDLQANTLTVMYEPSKLSSDQVIHAVGSKNLKVLNVSHKNPIKYATNLNMMQLPSWYISTAILSTLVSLLQYIGPESFFGYFRYLGIVALLMCLPVLYQHVQECILNKTIDHSLLLITTVSSALVTEAYSEGALLVSIYIAADWVNTKKNSDSKGDVMNKLRSICPKFATLAGGEIVNRNDVKTGSRLTISPGFMIPIDDTVVEGGNLRRRIQYDRAAFLS